MCNLLLMNMLRDAMEPKKVEEINPTVAIKHDNFFREIERMMDDMRTKELQEICEKLPSDVVIRNMMEVQNENEELFKPDFSERITASQCRTRANIKLDLLLQRFRRVKYDYEQKQGAEDDKDNTD